MTSTGRPKVGERRVVYCQGCRQRQPQTFCREDLRWQDRGKSRGVVRFGWKCSQCGLVLVVFQKEPE